MAASSNKRAGCKEEREAWARAAAARKSQISPEILSGCCHYLRKQHPHSPETWQQLTLSFPTVTSQPSHPTLPNKAIIGQCPQTPRAPLLTGQPHIPAILSALSPFKCLSTTCSSIPNPPTMAGHTLTLGPVWNWATCSSLLVSVHDPLSFQLVLLKCSQRTFLCPAALPMTDLSIHFHIFQVDPSAGLLSEREALSSHDF